MADADVPKVTDKPRKRQITGRKKDEVKKQRLSGHQSGPDCKCSRFKCFEVIGEERVTMLVLFNELSSKDEQDAFLASCIHVEKIKRRRPRMESGTAMPNDDTYSYAVHVTRNDSAMKVSICLKALCSIFGVTERRIRTVRDSMKKTGFPPKDQRGRHGNHPHKLTDNQKQVIHDHIQSFKGRQSHYSRNKSRRIYLPDTLNISKMLALFKEQHPLQNVSYESYRSIFNRNYNISFGYPRADTCSKCDELSARLNHCDKKLEINPNAAEVLKEKTTLLTEKELHHRKSETFYTRKRAAREMAKTDKGTLAVAFDFQQELHLPNLTTNDIFYRRQLSIHSFNIHELGGENVYIYSYDETVGKRGSDDVASMLYHFIQTYCPVDVKHLELFCDSCGGQNKNYTVFRFLYAQVHFWKRFESVKVTFPVRGHSYMECDRDFGFINKKIPAELPRDWFAEFRSARQRPSPYTIVEMTQEDFFNFSHWLKPKFKATCPVPSRPIRELVLKNTDPLLMFYRNNWHGIFDSALIVPRSKTRGTETLGQPKKLYCEPIAISEPKFKDLQVLKRFCSPQNYEFYENIPHQGNVTDKFHDVNVRSDSE